MVKRYADHKSCCLKEKSLRGGLLGEESIGIV